jgi:methylmalonyl-CoA mutase cobalamin-binding domain/chain
MLRFHTQTAGSSLTAQQPLNNVVRTTLEALAAVLGGTQSLHTNSYDEALALPSEQSVMVALRTQQILAHESGVADSVDPLAGSYLIENLTDRIETEAMRYIEEIDRLGGAVPLSRRVTSRERSRTAPTVTSAWWRKAGGPSWASTRSPLSRRRPLPSWKSIRRWGRGRGKPWPP